MTGFSAGDVGKQGFYIKADHDVISLEYDVPGELNELVGVMYVVWCGVV